jgi:hypothetical protein
VVEPAELAKSLRRSERESEAKGVKVEKEKIIPMMVSIFSK